MNKETSQNKNPCRVKGMKAVDKKPYEAPNITFIEDIEAVAFNCIGGKSGDSAECLNIPQS